MKTYVLNLFIVDDDSLKLSELKNYLDSVFGTSINISSFHDSDSMLKKIETYTNIVIMDYALVGGNTILDSIHKMNPKTELVMLTSFEDIVIAIESFQQEPADYIIQGEKLWNKKSITYKTISFPIRLILRAFGAYKLRAMF